MRKLKLGSGRQCWSAGGAQAEAAFCCETFRCIPPGEVLLLNDPFQPGGLMIFYFVTYVVLSGAFALSLAAPKLFPFLTEAVLGGSFLGILSLVTMQFLLSLLTDKAPQGVLKLQRGLLVLGLLILPVPAMAGVSILVLSFSFLISLGLWQKEHSVHLQVWSLVLSLVLGCVAVLFGTMTPEPERFLPHTYLMSFALILTLVRCYWLGMPRSPVFFVTLLFFTGSQAFGALLPAPFVAFFSIPFVSLLLTDVWRGCAASVRTMDPQTGRWAWMTLIPVVSVIFALLAVIPGASGTLPTLLPNLSLVTFLVLPLGIVMFDSLKWKELGFASACFTVGAISLTVVFVKFSGTGFSIHNMHAYDFLAGVIPYVGATFAWIGASVLCRLWVPLVGLLPEK